METPKCAESVVVACSPDEAYGMIADISRMGEWSPVCKACWWDEGQGPSVGSWFTGHNEQGDRVWENHNEVVAADQGREFAFLVADCIRWGYSFTPVSEGTLVTESWEIYPNGVAIFEERYGAEAEATIEARKIRARNWIVDTLSRFKEVADGVGSS